VSLLDTVMLKGGVAIGHSYADRWCRYWTDTVMLTGGVAIGQTPLC